MRKAAARKAVVRKAVDRKAAACEAVAGKAYKCFCTRIASLFAFTTLLSHPGSSHSSRGD